MQHIVHIMKRKFMRRNSYLILIASLISLLTTGVVLAREMIQGEQCTVEADEVVEGTLFTFCQNLVVEGRVEGNIIGIALRATISGEVTENVYLAGLELNLIGSIGRDLHYAGIVLDVQSSNLSDHQPIGGQIVFATLSVQLSEGIVIDGRITGAGYQFLINAQIEDEVNFWGSAFVLNNTINGDVYATVGNPESNGSDLEPILLPLNITQEFIDPGLVISENGAINGTLSYTGPVEGDIQGNVTERINYTSSTPVIIPITPDEEGTFNIFLGQFTREIMVLLTVGLGGLLFTPKFFQTSISSIRWRPVPNFVIGMLMFIVSFPIALILLLITAIIALILALLQLDGVLIVIGSFLGILDITLIGTFYFLAIFIARAIFCVGLGRFIVRNTLGHNGSQRMELLSMIVGVIIMAFLMSLPAIGFLFNATTLFMGLGAITSVFLEWLQQLRDTTYSNVRTARPDHVPLPPRFLAEVEVPQLPLQSDNRPPSLPPPSDEIGLHDLPDGFDPDFFFTDD